MPSMDNSSSDGANSSHGQLASLAKPGAAMFHSIPAQTFIFICCDSEFGLRCR